MPSYKLTYFDIRGLAEPARLLFALAKQEYTDHRFSFAFGVPGDFSTIKRPEFDEAKGKGELDPSLGKVPLLEVDGVKMGQSKAIERFLAREFGFMGASSVEACQIDALCESIIDTKNAYNKAKGLTDESAKTAAVAKYFKEDLPAFLALVEKSLPAGAGPWLVGSKISLADVLWYQFLLAPKGFFDDADSAKASFQACPKLKTAMEAVDANAELKDHFAKRKETMF